MKRADFYRMHREEIRRFFEFGLMGHHHLMWLEMFDYYESRPNKHGVIKALSKAWRVSDRHVMRILQQMREEI